MKTRTFLFIFTCLILSPGYQTADCQKDNNPIFSITDLKLLMLEDRYRDVIQVSERLNLPDSLMDEVWYLKGKAYQSLYKFDSSYQCFLRAAALDSNQVSYLVSQGIVLSRLGRNAEAIGMYEDLRRDSLADHQQLTDLAALYALRNNWPGSLEIYQELIREDSLNYYYLKQAGKSSQAMNLPDSALSYFKQAFELNPADPYLTHQIANIYLKKKDLENAIFSIQRGFEYDTANIDLLKLRGYLWLLLSQYEMAVYDFESAREQDSLSIFIQKYLGMSYHENKQFEEASEALSIAFRLDSLDYETSFFLASSLRWSKREEESISWYHKSLELMHPDSSDVKDVHLQLAELYKVLHRFDEALLAYDLAFDYDPADNTIYYKIGQVYDRNLDQKADAIKYYERYLTRGRTDQQLFSRDQERSTPMEEYVKKRITELKEELFFEGG